MPKLRLLPPPPALRVRACLSSMQPDHVYVWTRAWICVSEGLCTLAQPPLEEIPEGDWYCPTCVADGKDGKRRTRKKAAPKQATLPPPKMVPRNRALAAMHGPDEDSDKDSDADGAVIVKIQSHKDR